MSKKMSHRFAKSLALAVLAVAASCHLPARAAVPTPVNSSYVLTFDDEFNKTKLNTAAKWIISVGPGSGGYDSGFWTASNPKISNGCLVLPVYDTAPAGSPPYTGQYKFAGVRTKLAQKYGYWEARVNMPTSGKGTGDGIWPAFWLNAFNKLPEIDVMEWLGYQPTIDYMTLHYGDDITLHATPPSYDSPSFPSGWHVLGMLWTPKAITWYVDGIQRSQCTDPAAMAQFNVPLSAILNNSIVNKTKSWGAPVDPATIFPSNFYVDYVHIYSNAPGAKSVTPDPGYGGPGDDRKKTLPRAGVKKNVLTTSVKKNVLVDDGKKNLLTDGGFESGANWADSFGDAKVVKSEAQSGQYAAQITAGSSEQQTITGLKPDTTYMLCGYVKLATGGDAAVIGAKNYGGAEVNAPIFSTAYTQATVTFTTGKTNTTALIYFYKGNRVGTAFGDDFSVVEVSGANNPAP